jgi:hypothetical protein
MPDIPDFAKLKENEQFTIRLTRKNIHRDCQTKTPRLERARCLRVPLAAPALG